MNGVFEDDPAELKQRIISYYQEQIKLDFPDNTELLYANDDKGTLLETATALSLKLKINGRDRNSFEEQIHSKNGKVFVFRKSAWTNINLHMRGPKKIWQPENLKKSKGYAWDYPSGCGLVMSIGEDGEGNTILYIIYGV